MILPPHPFRVVRVFRGSSLRSGFTLIELLVVITIIAVLAAITLGISRGASERAATDRARAELAVLSTALEEYRRVFHDYPQQAGGAVLLAALAGRAGPTGSPLQRAPLVALEGFTLENHNPFLAGNVLLDPWNQPYVYSPYLAGPRRGFRLYSVGPDGNDHPPTSTGMIDYDAAANLDNVYAHR
ncbi:type II secretion system protein GspG [Synoicihabitans lomoniglobus]|uniref:Type II secretion system protein GspG n=1 Tax=Synoicihabitans lomoniglobus TaxID=2909285 RepID=A0AAF0CS67_9BACT|nr:type II secretion system protein GspG [Opitutaceae bacterium LMO-M01]WED67119.1 type II secretion system protein GspG [Opitutaceae bacterium LMO-M01]